MDPWNYSKLAGDCPVCGEGVELAPTDSPEAPPGNDAADPEMTPRVPVLRGTCARCNARLVSLFDGRIVNA